MKSLGAKCQCFILFINTFFKTIFSLSRTHIEYPNRNLEHNLVFLMNHQKMTFEVYPQLSSLHNHQMARTHPLMK